MNNQYDQLKQLDVGPETLQMLDSYVDRTDDLNHLHKNVKQYTIEDISQWLSTIGLEYYVNIFKDNHITGKNVLEILQEELKEEFGMNSLGHRKIFTKQQNILKKMQNVQVRDKIQKVLAHKNNTTVQKGKEQYLRTRQDNRGRQDRESKDFNSLYSNNNLYSKYEVIEEVEQSSVSSSQSKQHKYFREDDFVFNKSQDSGTPGEDIKGNQNRNNSRNNLANLKLKKKTTDEKENTIISDKDCPDYTSTRKDQMDEEVEQVQVGRRLFVNQFGSFQVQTHQPKDNQKEEDENNKKILAVNQNLLFSSSFSSSDEESNSDSSTDKQKQNTSNDEANNIVNKLKNNNSNSNINNNTNNKKLFMVRNTKKKPPKKSQIQKKQQKTQKQLVKKVGIGTNTNFLIDYKELEFVKKVGEGAYGEVYKAVWLGQEVAVKQYGKNIPDKRMKKKTADFIKEVDVISNLRHPNIVLYMGICINHSQYLMITEYLDGGSLFDLLHQKHVRIKDDHLIHICQDLALGLNYLHSQRIMHCDLKSSNILIDEHWNIKLCDFGLSRVRSKLASKEDGNRGLVGTPHWSAPEILRGKRYSEQADVYSYGMIIWEMLTQKIPYLGLSTMQIIGSVGFDSGQVQIPTEGAPLILKIIRMCLQKDRNKRPTFNEIVSLLHVSNRDKEKKRFVIKELQRFFG